MMQNISDKALSDILGRTLSKSAVIDAKTQEAYEMIRGMSKESAGERKNGIIVPEKKRTEKRIFAGIASAAAVFFLACVLCVMNPVIAKEIPILGSLFMKVADIFTFGNIPEQDTESLYGSHYRIRDENITITLTEEYASNQAFFIGIRIENIEEFPELVTLIGSGAQFLDIRTEETYSFRPEPIITRRRIEGKFEDEHTFIGIMRIDYSELIEDDHEIPSSFDMKLEITQIIGTLLNPTRPEGMKSDEELAQMSDEEMTDYMNSLPKEWNGFPNPYKHWYCDGNWHFEIPITQVEEAGCIIQLNKVNEEGIGIESIELSPVEMTVKESVPLNEKRSVITIAFDAEGREISLTGSMNVYAVAGHDVSTIYLYVCDFEDFSDALTEYDSPGNKESYQTMIEKCALTKVVVDTQTYKAN